MANKIRIIFIFSILFFVFSFTSVFADELPVPKGTLLYRSSPGGLIYGYSTNVLLSVLGDSWLNSGHVGIYVGKVNGISMVLEANEGVVRLIPAERFANLKTGEKFIGAKIPKDFDPSDNILVKNLENLYQPLTGKAYDNDFRQQKGPGEGDWICVGLTEKLYESLDKFENPKLIYLNSDPVCQSSNKPENIICKDKYGGIDITPDGFDSPDNYPNSSCFSVAKENLSSPQTWDSSSPNCFSKTKEFSYLKEISSLEHALGDTMGRKDEKGIGPYIFFPATQFYSDKLKEVQVDSAWFSSEFEPTDNFLGSLASVLSDVSMRVVTGFVKTENALIAVAQNGAQVVVNAINYVKEKIIGSNTQGQLQLAQTIDLNQNQTSPVNSEENISQNSQNQQTDSGQQQQTNQENQQSVSTSCLFNNSQSPSHLKVIINEVAWMGGLNGANDEWIELKNISNSPLDISGYQLIDKDEKIKIVFESGSKISLAGFYLLERADDNTVPEIAANVIYSGVLSNTNEGLQLFDSQCNLIDEVLANPDWSAGDNAAKKTMERGSDLTWYTSSVVGGTPKKENSQPEFIPKNIPTLNSTSTQILTSTSTSTSTPITNTSSICSFNTNQPALRQGIIINEIAWMGTTNSANDEWVELKNIAGVTTDISNWQLLSKEEKIKIKFDNGSQILAGGFYLLERTDDDTVLGIKADKIYTGGLSNTNEGLRLFDGQCNLIDEVSADPDWPAGDNTATAKKTMERKSDFSWYSSSIIGGTPRKENSTPAAVYTSGGGGGGSVSNQSSNNPPPQSYLVIINEIMYDLPGSDESREWIEIFNNGNAAVDLTNWKFYENQTNHGLTLSRGSANLATGGYAIIADDPDQFLIDNPGFAGTIFKSSFSLNNTGEAIATKNGDSVIDEVSYSSDWGAKGDGNSLQKINGEWRSSLPTPGRENILTTQANQTPGAFFVYTPENLMAGDLIAFNAASSSDPDGNIIFYQWDFGDNATSTISTATTTHTYSQAGSYQVNLIVFDDQNASSTTASTTISINPGGASHIVISEIQVKGDSADDEFIELYNPTSNTISLADYSIQYLSGVATSTDKINDTKKNFENSAQIAPHGFFLLVNSQATSSLLSKKDMTYSFSLSGNQSGATIFLVNSTTPISTINDSIIIDSLSYGNPQLAVSAATSTVPDFNKGLERKAFYNNQCVSSQNEGEFLGNGCDTDSVDDFEIRLIPNPQNSFSFPEPRSAPIAPADFVIQYSSSTMELILNWNVSQDYSGATSTLTYKITDISNATSTLEVINTASTTAEISINERGRSYVFSIQAFDKEGLGSEKSEAQIDIPPIKQTIRAQQLDDTAETGAGQSDPFVQRLSLSPNEFQGSFNRIELKVFSDDGYNYSHSLWIKEIDPNNVLGYTLLFYTNDADLGILGQWNTIIYDVGKITTKLDKIYEFAIRGRYGGIGGPGSQSNLKVKGSSNPDSYPYGNANGIADLYFKIYLEE